MWVKFLGTKKQHCKRVVEYNYAIFFNSSCIISAFSEFVVTEIIQEELKSVKKKNDIIISNEIIKNNILAIFNIFSKLNFNDQLDGLRMISDLILAQKIGKSKRKKSKKHY